VHTNRIFFKWRLVPAKPQIRNLDLAGQIRDSALVVLLGDQNLAWFCGGGKWVTWSASSQKTMFLLKTDYSQRYFPIVMGVACLKIYYVMIYCCITLSRKIKANQVFVVISKNAAFLSLRNVDLLLPLRRQLINSAFDHIVSLHNLMLYCSNFVP